MCSQSAAVTWTEETARVWEDNGVSTDLLEWWHQVETLRGSEWHSRIPVEVRVLALRYMEAMAKAISARKDAFFQCASLLDKYVEMEALQPEDVPVLCAAIAILVLKTEYTISRCERGDICTEQACKFLSLLKLSGLASPDAAVILRSVVSTQECKILLALDGRVRVPSVFCWIDAFLLRLNLCTCFCFWQEMHWIASEGAEHCSRLYVFAHAGKQKLAPRTMARGIMTLGLAACGLLHPETVRDPCFQTDEWLQLVLRGCVPRFFTTYAPPPRAEWLCKEDAATLLAHVCAALDCEMPAVRRACATTAVTLRDSVSALGAGCRT